MSEIVDIFTRHAHFVERYKTGQYRRFLPFIRKIEESLRAELLKTNTVRSQRIKEKKLKDIERMLLFFLGEFTDSFEGQLELFAESEMDFGLKAIGNEFDAAIPAIARLKAAYYARPFNNRLLKDYLSDFTKQQAKLIRDAISIGFFEGLTTPEIIKNIIGTRKHKFKDGILNITKISASRMVRTSVTHVAAVAKDRLYKENSDIIKNYEWIATLDGRTSEICRGLDGNIYEVGKGKLPPAHFNCRSTTAPVLKVDDEL